MEPILFDNGNPMMVSSSDKQCVVLVAEVADPVALRAVRTALEKQGIEVLTPSSPRIRILADLGGRGPALANAIKTLLVMEYPEMFPRQAWRDLPYEPSFRRAGPRFPRRFRRR